MMNNLINLENGELHFGNQEYIGAKTTFDEVKKMKGTIDNFFENAEMGIQNLHFYNKEIEDDSYHISVHFNFGKLSMIFIHFKNGTELLETSLWKEITFKKRLNQSKINKSFQQKTKKYNWGAIFTFYSSKTNLGEISISYKQ